MTTLILTHKKLLPLRLVSFFWDLSGRFEKTGSSNLMKKGLLAAVIFSVVTYLAALFLSFSLGFQIQEQTASQKELAKALRWREIFLQQRIDLLAEGRLSQLESMEKVSSIRYLRPENVAVSRSSLQP